MNDDTQACTGHWPGMCANVTTLRQAAIGLGILMVCIEIGYVLLKNFAIFNFVAGCFATCDLFRWLWRLNGSPD